MKFSEILKLFEKKKAPQLNRVFKNTENPKKFCANSLQKKEETLQIKRVSKYRKMPQKFWGNA